MTERPTIKTERLILGPYTLDDAPELQRLIGDRDIASTTLNIPHPYEDGMAEEWIGKPYWNQGYCTEAARAVLKYGFAVLGLNRVHASYMTRNPASGRVI